MYSNPGTNVVVVRNPILAEILEEGVKSNSLSLDEVGAKTIIQSQDANYRHRRTGLSYRLYLMEKQGKWHPPKRVK
jgi:hypothetical protein